MAVLVKVFAYDVYTTTTRCSTTGRGFLMATLPSALVLTLTRALATTVTFTHATVHFVTGGVTRVAQGTDAAALVLEDGGFGFAGFGGRLLDDETGRGQFNRNN